MVFSGLVYQLPLVNEPPAEPPCQICPAICCNYFALQIDTPNCLKDFENIRWYLMHQKVHIFVDEGKWYLQVWTQCQHLQGDNRCGIYQTRPLICQEYGEDSEGAVNCHATSESNNEYDLLFTEPEQLEQYYQAWYDKRFGWRNGKKRKAAGKKKAHQ
jgi:Fe-S-cluster containining protein